MSTILQLIPVVQPPAPSPQPLSCTHVGAAGSAAHACATRRHQPFVPPGIQLGRGPAGQRHNALCATRPHTQERGQEKHTTSHTATRKRTRARPDTRGRATGHGSQQQRPALHDCIWGHRQRALSMTQPQLAAALAQRGAPAPSPLRLVYSRTPQASVCATRLSRRACWRSHAWTCHLYVWSSSMRPSAQIAPTPRVPVAKPNSAVALARSATGLGWGLSTEGARLSFRVH